MQHDFVLLDRSQSMSTGGRWQEALAAINTYVAKLAVDKVDTGVTLAAFDEHDGKFCYEVLRNRITPSTWKPVSDEDAAPRGWTPLNDAIGKMVEQALAGKYEKVAMIIVTDGEENSSTELSAAQAKKRLTHCRAKGWQVIFLGADYENMSQAASYGNARGMSMPVGAGLMKAAMTSTARKRGLYGSGAAATMEYTEEERADFAKQK